MYSRSADRFYSEKARRITEITAAMLDKKAAAQAKEGIYEIYEEYADKLTGPDEDIPEELYDKVSDKGTEPAIQSTQPEAAWWLQRQVLFTAKTGSLR